MSQSRAEGNRSGAEGSWSGTEAASGGDMNGQEEEKEKRFLGQREIWKI